jgi:hypothetical protein
MAVEEPSITYPEEHFQNAVVAVIRDILQTSGRQFIVAESFGLDIAVFVSAEEGTVARFIEVKAFGAQRMGGVGFGNGRGLGSQVDLLLSQAECLPLLSGVVRWVFVDATQPVGSRRYCLFTCEAAKAAAMGGAARGKQNNLRVSALRDRFVDWLGLRARIAEFLSPAGAGLS